MRLVVIDCRLFCADYFKLVAADNECGALIEADS